MSSGQTGETGVEVTAENVGGIDETTVSLQPGVTVLEGRNASNRTSLLQAIMAGLGSNRSTLKGDADDGRVELTFDEETYDRRLVRKNGQVVFEGDPYLDDPTVADLFAFLLETNEARLAVQQGGDLRDLIMQPIDTEEINADIERLEEEKREIDERLSTLDRLSSELPNLEERRTSLQETIEQREAELDDLEAEVEALEEAESESDQDQGDVEAAFEELRRARRDLEDVEFDLETERETRSELKAEREELSEQLDDLEDVELGSPAELSGRLDELRDRKRTLDATVSELQSVIRFNEERLEEGGFDLEGTTEERADGGSVTDQLVADQEAITCWTCGSTVERERIEDTLERLRELHRERLDERSEVTERIDDLSSRRKEIREHERNRERLEDRLDEIEHELESQADRIEELEEAREQQEDTVADLEAETDDLETSDDEESSEVVELHRQITQIELELDNHRGDLEEVEARIDEIESQLDEREDHEERREAITDELTELRTRVERIEADAVEAFNEHMESILGILEYANIDRIWIERREREVREGRRTVSQSTFDLHVVRSTADGATYEDTVDHLSESEREVTGLVFALAGFLVHDVHEVVPFMLLDSLEAIDSERIADLVDYFESYVDCLVVALLPEDAQALSGDYEFLTEI